MLTLPALHVLLDLATGNCPPTIELSPEEWQQLLDVAESAAVAPPIDATVLRGAKAGLCRGLTPTALVRIQERAADTAASASAWQADLHATLDALEGVGIIPIALKGAALVAHGVIGPAERHMHDLDLLIPAEGAAEARRSLMEHGFEEPDEDALPGVDGRPRSESRWRDPHIAFHAVGPFGTPVEVHLTASRISGGTWSELAPVMVTNNVDGRRVLAPTLARLRNMLNEHVFYSHLSDPRLLLRHVADLSALNRTGGARAAEATLQAGTRLGRAERLLMWLARVRETQPGLLTAAQTLLLARDGANAERVETIWHLLEALEVLWHDLRHRRGLILRRVVPHPAYLAALYGLPLEEAGELRTHLRRWRELRTGLGGSRRRQ